MQMVLEYLFAGIAPKLLTVKEVFLPVIKGDQKAFNVANSHNRIVTFRRCR